RRLSPWARQRTRKTTASSSNTFTANNCRESLLPPSDLSLMTEEGAFISAILACPRNDAPRLIFADWLEERGDPRGEVLRVSVRLEALFEQDPPKEMRVRLQRVREIARLQQRLRELRELIPLDWALRLSRGWIDQCNLVGWGVNCPRRWELLFETDDPTVRG